MVAVVVFDFVVDLGDFFSCVFVFLNWRLSDHNRVLFLFFVFFYDKYLRLEEIWIKNVIKLREFY